MVPVSDLVKVQREELQKTIYRKDQSGGCCDNSAANCYLLAEHTARTFEAVDVLLRETATDLSHSRRDWENWEASKGWEYIAQRHSRSMPQLRG